MNMGKPLLRDLHSHSVEFIEPLPRPEKWFSSDFELNRLFPAPMQSLARRHWTPLSIAHKAATFLGAEKKARVLDIGSGIGKFCLGAAYFKPEAFFTGVEQRKDLHEIAQKARQTLGLKNVSFIHGNFTQLQLKDFHHFYFYNAFYENLDGSDKIDDNIDYSGELFNYYNCYLFKQLDQMRKGTRLATFHSLEDEVPSSYFVVETHLDGLLKFWIKA